MTRTVLVLGRTRDVIDDVLDGARVPGVELHGGTGIDDLRATFARTPVDHVIMGGGLDLETRLGIVRETFTLSKATTVHMKDVASGPEGMLPFVRALLGGLDGWLS